MGISSRFIRKFLASKLLVFGFWLIIVCPWFLLWFIQTPKGYHIWTSYINEALRKKEENVLLFIEDVHFDPRESLSIQKIRLMNGIPLLSSDGLLIEWGIQKGIDIQIKEIVVQSDVSAWGRLLSSEKSSSSEPFSWKGMGGINIPFTVDIESLHVLLQEETKARIQWRMYGEIMDVIDVQNIFINVQANELPKISLHGRVQYQDTSIIVPNMSIDSAGIDHRFAGNMNMASMDFDMKSATHIPKYSLEVWTAKRIPSEDMLISNHLAGNLENIQADAIVKIASTELPIDIALNVSEQTWLIDARPKYFSLTNIAPDLIKDTVLNGSYTISGKGFQLEAMDMDVHIRGEDERIWSEAIPQWSVQAKKTKEIVSIEKASLQHMIGDVRISGDVDLQAESSNVQIALDIPVIRHLEKYGVQADGTVSYNGTCSVFWKDSLFALIHGELHGNAVAYEGYNIQNFMSNIDLSYQDGNIQGDVEVDSYDIYSDTAHIVQFYSNISVEYTNDVVASAQYEMYGLDVREKIFLDHLSGELSIDGLQSITSKGNIERLILFEQGARSDRGSFFIDYHSQNIYSELILEHKRQSLLNIVLGAQLDKGELKLGKFDFHPLPDILWKLDGPAFYYTQGRHKGKGQIHLTSKIGQIHLDIIKERASIEIVELEVQGLERLAGYFLGTEVWEENSSGKLSLNTQVNNMDVVEGSIKLSDFSFSNYVQHLNIDTSISGRILHPTVTLRAYGTNDILRVNSSIHMNSDFTPDCSKDVSFNVSIPVYTLEMIHKILPMIPEIDIDVGASLRISRSICDPEIHLSVQGTYPIGKERISLESYIHRDNDISIRTSILRAFVPKLSALGTIKGQFTDFFSRLINKGEVLEISDVIQNFDIRLLSSELSLAQVLHMYSIDAAIQGFLHGDISISGNAKDPILSGSLWIEDGMMGDVLMNTSKLEVSTNTEGFLFNGTLGLDNGIGKIDGMLSRDLTTISVDIESEEIPFRSLFGVVPDLTDGFGTFSLNGYVRGPFNALDHSLHLQVNTGGLTYRKANVALTDINLDAVVEIDQIRILSCALQSFSLRTKDFGSASLKGTLKKKGFVFESGALDLSLSKFWLLDRSDQSYRISGNIQARYLPEKLFDFSGAIELNQGRLILDSSFFTDQSTQILDSKIHLYTPKAKLFGSEETEEEEKSWMQVSDIRLDLNQQLYMTAEFPLIDQYNKELSMLSTAYVDGVFDGELTLKMDAKSLSLEGDVAAVRGELKAMGATFTMAEAKLSFLGKDYSNPIMDILATRTIDSYDVSTSLTGTVAIPKIAFSSTSATPLSQTDLISLILFGRISSELGDNNPLLSSVMTSLSGSMNQILGSSLVDRFSWDPSSQQIEIGVALNEKLYFNVTQLYQGQNQDIQSQTVLGLEWFIMKRMYMEMLSTPKSGSVSGYVFYRWRY